MEFAQTDRNFEIRSSPLGSSSSPLRQWSLELFFGVCDFLFPFPFSLIQIGRIEDIFIVNCLYTKAMVIFFMLESLSESLQSALMEDLSLLLTLIHPNKKKKKTRKSMTVNPTLFTLYNTAQYKPS